MVVVEHDPEIITRRRSRHRHGPGRRRGGRRASLRQGRVAAISPSPRSLTGRYLRRHAAASRCRPSAARPRRRRSTSRSATRAPTTCAASTSRIPLARMVCVTGVSGSGKSTLVEEVLHRGLLRRRGLPTAAARRLRRASTAPRRSPRSSSSTRRRSGRTPRANAATYTKMFDGVRRLLRGAPMHARLRGFSGRRRSRSTSRAAAARPAAATASSRSRCSSSPTCSWSCAGVQRPALQPDVLEVALSRPEHRRRPRADRRRGARRSSPTARDRAGRCSRSLDVGLGYLRLGQPLSTLSGGEAQRIKLAAHLGRDAQGAHALRLRRADDRPALRRHRALLAAFAELVERGHSLLIVEHNVEVIKCADHVIDLGPEGGDGGGRSSPRARPRRSRPARRRTPAASSRRCWPTAPSPTGRRAPAPPIRRRRSRHRSASSARASTTCRNLEPRAAARSHDRRHGPVRLGQVDARVRRHLRRGPAPLPREPVDVRAAVHARACRGPTSITCAGIPPTIAIEQRLSRGGRKSTVATVTEVCALSAPAVREGRASSTASAATSRFARCRAARSRAASRSASATARSRCSRPSCAAGRASIATCCARRAGCATRRCASTGRSCRSSRCPSSIATASTTSTSSWRALGGRRRRRAAHASRSPTRFASGRASSSRSPAAASTSSASGCSARRCGLGYEVLDPRLFSFNSRQGACPTCHGLGISAELDAELRRRRPRALAAGRARSPALGELGLGARSGSCCAQLKAARHRGRSAVQAPDRPAAPARARGRRQADHGRAAAAATHGFVRGGRGVGRAARPWSPRRCARTSRSDPAPNATGTRLNPRARAVRVLEHDLPRARRDDGRRVRGDHRRAGGSRPARRRSCATFIAELAPRLRFLATVGLGYLTLDRSADTLSGGEAQRIRLAAQLGSNLRGACYVLDEPTIGLHPRDNALLLESLRDAGRAPQHGDRGRARRGDDRRRRSRRRPRSRAPGVTAARSSRWARRPRSPPIRSSLTGRYLGRRPRARRGRRVPTDGPCLTIHGATRAQSAET